jgi:hypothetical protein
MLASIDLPSLTTQAHHLFGCQPSVHLGGNAQTRRFSERRTSPFSVRHLAGVRYNLCCAVIPNAAIRRMLSVLLHDQSTLCPWRKRLSECFGSDRYFVNVIALGAFEHAEIETRARRHDAREHHVSMAPWAGGALDLNVDVVGNGIEFGHDASLKEAGARHSQSPVMCLTEVAVMGAALLIEFRFAVPY